MWRSRLKWLMMNAIGLRWLVGGVFSWTRVTFCFTMIGYNNDGGKLYSGPFRSVSVRGGAIFCFFGVVFTFCVVLTAKQPTANSSAARFRSISAVFGRFGDNWWLFLFHRRLIKRLTALLITGCTHRRLTRYLLSFLRFSYPINTLHDQHFQHE